MSIGDAGMCGTGLVVAIRDAATSALSGFPTPILAA